MVKRAIVRNIYSRKVDSETGEILEYVDKTEVVKKDSEPFFLTYSKEIMALYGKSIFNVTTKVFWKLLEFAEYNTGQVYMNTVRREEIMRICGISRTSFDRAIRELVEADIITKDRDTYTIDENMFWKGDRKAREAIKKARLKVSFSPVFDDEESPI